MSCPKICSVKDKAMRCTYCDGLYCKACKTHELISISPPLHYCCRRHAYRNVESNDCAVCKAKHDSHSRECALCGLSYCVDCKKLKMKKKKKKVWECYACLQGHKLSNMKKNKNKRTPSLIEDTIDVTHLVEPSLNLLESRNQLETRKYGDKKKGYFRLSKNNLSLKSKLCVFVLGPSASGKTFLTFAQLPRVLQLNGISIQDDSDVSFVSVDGGLMRDT